MRDFFTRSLPATLTGFFGLVFRIVVAAIVLMLVLWIVGLLLGVLAAVAGIALAIPAIIINLIWIAFVIWALILLITFAFSLWS